MVRALNRLYSTVVLCIAWFSLWCPQPAYSFEVATHQRLNNEAVDQTISGFSLDIFLRTQLGFGRGINEPLQFRNVRAWIAEGGVREDDRLRFFHHFHDQLLP